MPYEQQEYRIHNGLLGHMRLIDAGQDKNGAIVWCIFFYENCCISIQILLNLFPRV